MPSLNQVLFSLQEKQYFKVSTTSGVTIQSLSLVNLNVFYPTQVSLRSSTVNTALGNLANLTTTGFNYSPSSSELVFAFDMTVGSGASSFIFNNGGNIDQVFTFTLVADIDVTYKTTFGKRDIKTETMKLSQEFVIDLRNTLKKQQEEEEQVGKQDSQNVPSSSSTLFYGSILPLSMALASLLL